MKCEPRPELTEALKRSKEIVDAMTDEEREAMYAAQRASFVRGELSWPAARFKMVNGVKVYESYADYCA